MTLRLKKLLIPAFIVLALFATGCSSSKKKTDSSGQETDSSSMTDSEATSPEMGSGDTSGLELSADSDSGKAGSLSTVNFAFDSYELSSTARNRLADNAEFLKSNSSVEVQVEGHCDERGGVQYNIALGENRAKAVKDYLIALGVESRRITTISYGKERPLAFGHDEDSWQQNRRANFVVTAK